MAASASATTSAMPMPQLKTRSISAAAMPPVRASQPNTGGTVQERFQHRHRAVRQDARQVAGQAAAGDVRGRLQQPGAVQRQQRLRRRSASAPSAPGRASGRRRTARARPRPRPLACDHAADQGEAVGVQAGAGQAEHRIARRDAARQQPSAFHRADGEAGQVVVAAADTCRASPRSRRPPARSRPRCSPRRCRRSPSRAWRHDRACRWRNSRGRTAARRPARPGR